jgi:hypothetical protein
MSMLSRDSQWLWSLDTLGGVSLSSLHLGECDVPRVVRREGEEYEFVAAILHSTDPAYWPSRVLYRNNLYSGQA